MSVVTTDQTPADVSANNGQQPNMSKRNPNADSCLPPSDRLDAGSQLSPAPTPSIHRRSPTDRLRDLHASAGVYLSRAAVYLADGERFHAEDFLRAAEHETASLLGKIRDLRNDLYPPECRQEGRI